MLMLLILITSLLTLNIISKYPEAAFTRVRFDQVKRLGSSYVGAEVAKYINIVKNHRYVCTYHY